MHLGGYRRSLLPCHYYCIGNDIPIAAHVDRSRIISQRKERVGLTIRRYNPPAVNLGELQLKRVTPVESLHDPYLVALLIALGQLQCEALGLRKTQQAAGVTVGTLSVAKVG